MIVFFAVVLALGTLHVNVTALLASAGVVGVALGFGAQYVIRDVLAGFSLLSEGIVQVGDIVRVDQDTGTVERVALRTLQIRKANGELLTIPNGQIGRIGNLSRDFGVAMVRITVPYRADIAKALDVLRAAATAWAAAEGAEAGAPPVVNGVVDAQDTGVVLQVSVRVPPGRQWAVEADAAAARPHGAGRGRDPDRFPGRGYFVSPRVIQYRWYVAAPDPVGAAARPVPLGRRRMQKPVGHLVFALHTHLPFVLNHGRWPHGSDWLSEVTVECYLPLLRALTRLAKDDVGPTVTINISPILAEQLASAAFREEMTGYLEQRRQICRETRRYFSDTHADDLAALCDYWRDVYEGLEREFEEINGDLLGQFRALADRGTIELISTAATHGYFPLLSRDESLDLQLRVAVAAHAPPLRRGRRAGCGSRSARTGRGTSGRRRSARAAARCATSGAASRNCSRRTRSSTSSPTFISCAGARRCRRTATTFRACGRSSGPRGSSTGGRTAARTPAYRVASRGGTGDAVAYVRDPETTLQVWSRDAGYPGDEWYLEFHKRHFPGGLRFWRVTHPKSDLADKQVYVPERAEERTRAHAAHFTQVVRGVLARYAGETGRAGVLCSPFDTELFGHWWAEGPSWLEHVFRGLRAEGIAAVTAGA